MKTTFFVICVAALAACTSSAPRWEKPGASQTAVDEALQDCRVKARLNPQQRIGAHERPGSGTPGIDRIEDRDRAELGSIDRCMREKGYAAGTR
jgi:hypothetical protein